MLGYKSRLAIIVVSNTPSVIVKKHSVCDLDRIIRSLDFLERFCEFTTFISIKLDLVIISGGVLKTFLYLDRGLRSLIILLMAMFIADSLVFFKRISSSSG